jgi:RND family efflux transporter MFP subunit
MSRTASNNTLTQKWLPLIVLIAALVITIALIRSRHAPTKHPFVDRGTLVEGQQVVAQNIPLRIKATGTVQPRQQLRLSPQVGGNVISLHPQLRIGGQINAGELLLSIDPRDYVLARNKAQNVLSSARLQFEQVTNQAEVAKSEWLSINGDLPQPPLAAYTPQLKQAQAGVKAAKADVEQAELNLNRTKLYALYDCRVVSENVDLGQNLMAGAEIALLIGTKQAEVIVPIPIDELPWLKIDKSTKGDMNQSTATVSITTKGKQFSWPATFDRTLANVDEHGRMSRVIVTVNSPYSTHKQLPLQMGMFVDVELDGITLEQMFSLPRSALRDESTLWLADKQQRLQIQPITVIRKEQQRILVTGLSADDYVITSAISGAANGMKLRFISQEHTAGVPQ